MLIQRMVLPTHLPLPNDPIARIVRHHLERVDQPLKLILFEAGEQLNLLQRLHHRLYGVQRLRTDERGTDERGAEEQSVEQSVEQRVEQRVEQSVQQSKSRHG